MRRSTIRRLAALPQALISLASATVSVVTLGLVWPGWEMDFLVWVTKFYVRNGEP